LATLNLAAGNYRFGAVWDGAKLWKDACITVEGERITAVGACSGASVDLTRYTAIPGMIDVHTHMTYVQENPVSQAGRGDIAGDSSMPTMSVMRWNWMLLAGI
jgi:imidazolonepropionase-like amidohydrolase